MQSLTGLRAPLLFALGSGWPYLLTVLYSLSSTPVMLHFKLGHSSSWYLELQAASLPS